MKVVVDTSVLIAVIANEPEKPALIEKTRGAELLAPPSVHWEIGNAFSAMLKRNRITYEQAQQAFSLYRQIPIQWVEVELEESLEMAHRGSRYADDAYLLVCARNQGCTLLTLDHGLQQAAREAQVPLLEVSS